MRLFIFLLRLKKSKKKKSINPYSFPIEKIVEHIGIASLGRGAGLRERKTGEWYTGKSVAYWFTILLLSAYLSVAGSTQAFNTCISGWLVHILTGILDPHTSTSQSARAVEYTNCISAAW